MKTMRPTFLLAILASAAIVSPLHAQELDSPPPQVSTSDDSNQVSQLDQERVSMEATHNGMFLKDAQLNEVLQVLALKADKQYFHNSSLNGPSYTVTGHLNDGEPLKQMDALAFQYGLELFHKDDTVYALSPQDVQQLPQEEWTYRLKYLRPSDWETIQSIIQPLLSPTTGSVNFEPKTNTILVIDTSRRIERVEAFLNKLDRPKGQIIVETKILRVTSAAGSRIGVDWSSTLGETGLTINAAQSLNSLFNLPDTSGLVKTASSVTTDTTSTSTPIPGGLTTGNRDYFNETNRGSQRTSEYTPGSGLVLSPIQLQAVLRALNEGDLANQKSNPTLITEDNEQALITIIDRVPIITATVNNTSAGSNITEEVRYTIDEDDPTLSDDDEGDKGNTREIGVTLTITPTLLPDNTIRMDLRPRTAQIVEFITGATGNQYPRVSESMVQAIARVPNGHSLIIGGFYGYADKKAENKVPILGDIPFVGFFFKSKETTKEQTSLVFIITPTAYDPASALENLRANNSIYDNVAMDSDHNEIFAPNNPGVAHRENLPNTLRNMVLDTKEQDRDNARIELIRESPDSEEFNRKMEEYEATYREVKRAKAEESGEVVTPEGSDSKKFSGSMFE